MIRIGAFGDEGRKQALLDDIGTQGPLYTYWLTPAAFESDLTPLTRDYGLHPAFVRLLPVVGGHGQGAEAQGFYMSALADLPVGADELRLVRSVLLAAWTHPVYGLADQLRQSQVFAETQDVIGLVSQSLTAPVDKKAWRAARTRLALAKKAAGLEDDLVDPILSMAWDLDQAPGAAQDVVLGWGGVIFTRASAQDEDQLSGDEQEELMGHMGLVHRQATEKLGELRQGDAEQYWRYRAEVDLLWAADPRLQALKRRSDQTRERVTAKHAAWRSEVQRDLLRHIQASRAPMSA